MSKLKLTRVTHWEFESQKELTHAIKLLLKQDRDKIRRLRKLKKVLNHDFKNKEKTIERTETFKLGGPF